MINIKNFSRQRLLMISVLAFAFLFTASAAFAALTASSTALTSDGALTLTGAAASTWSTSAGALTITSAAAATWSTSAGALSIDSAAALNLGNSTATSASICNSATCDTITIGSNADADTITIGDSTDTTVSITDDNWSVTAAGVATFVNALVTASATTGLDTLAAGALSLGNVTATSVSVCNSAACDTITLGTNTDADTITIGEAADDVSITDVNWSIGATGIATLNSVQVTAAAGVDTNGAAALNIGSTNATSVVIGRAGATAITLTTDGSGTGEVVLPLQSIAGAEMVNDTVTETQLAATVTFADNDLLDLGLVTYSDGTAGGLKLPNVGASPTDVTGATEGYIAWNETNNQLLVNDGSAWVTAIGNTTAANTWTDNQIFTLAGDEDIAVTHDAGAAANVLSITVTPSATAAVVQGIKLQQANSANTNGLDTGIEIENNDADLALTTGLFIESAAAGGFTDAVLINATAGTITDAIQIGSGSETITNAINIASTGVTTDIIFQNGATLANNTNNELALVENSLTLNLDFGEVASTVKAESASALELESTANVTGAIVIDSTVGGINITASGAAATEDITVVATGSSIGLTATESINDAIRITASGANGAIVLAAGEATAAGTNATVSIISETIFDNTANVAFAAQTVLDADGTETVTPTSSYIILQCNVAAAGNTAITMSETGATSGQLVIFTVDGVANNAGTCSMADSAGVQQGSAATLDDFDALTIIYDGAQWVQVATSNN